MRMWQNADASTRSTTPVESDHEPVNHNHRQQQYRYPAPSTDHDEDYKKFTKEAEKIRNFLLHTAETKDRNANVLLAQLGEQWYKMYAHFGSAQMRWFADHLLSRELHWTELYKITDLSKITNLERRQLSHGDETFLRHRFPNAIAKLDNGTMDHDEAMFMDSVLKMRNWSIENGGTDLSR